VKKYSYFFQFQNGASFLLGNTRGTGVSVPEWQTKIGSNQGGTAIYALRLGKADVSKLKMEFNLKKKFTTSNFLKASPWQLRIGLGLQRYEVAQKSDFEINLKTDKTVEFKTQTLDYQKNTLAVYYIHVPITVWRKLTDKSFIEVGGFVDVLRKSTQTLAYKQGEINNSLTRKGNFGINEIAYGATATIGGNAAALYINYHLSSLFAKHDTYNYNLMSVGVKVGY
jgi:hypothetical protein